AVPSSSIVEGLGVFRYVGNRQLAVLVEGFLDSLFLQAAKEGFRDCVVPAVSFSTHAWLKPIGCAEPPPGVAAVLRALIGMDEGMAWLSLLHRLHHGIKHELAMDCRTRRPADDLT